MSAAVAPGARSTGRAPSRAGRASDARGLHGECRCGSWRVLPGPGWLSRAGRASDARGLHGESCGSWRVLCGPGLPEPSGRATDARGLHGECRCGSWRAQSLAPGKGAAVIRQRARGRTPRVLHGAEGKAPGKAPLSFASGRAEGRRARSTGPRGWRRGKAPLSFASGQAEGRRARSTGPRERRRERRRCHSPAGGRKGAARAPRAGLAEPSAEP